ncbi:TetR/AcrR family transcriptional regulator [uncultured Corynebacterium sp.]|uniref:TetR/AcrR family transcriptional regulator n=1 Tax=uncultured Corynebacterium sp. TaxID=159447 RepID=UPI0025FF9C69|nr:TetR/AcrR family transcriptional regulator [uncultured Corynebacterium sp.]
MSQATATPPATTRGRPGYAREDVIRIAVKQFNTHGYEATSMGALATTLGITKSAIYHHISSKEEILVSATDQALEALFDILDTADELEGTAKDRLSLAISGATRVLCENPENVTLLLRLRGNTEVEKQILERRRKITRKLIEYVDAAQVEGAVRSNLDAGMVARLTFGMINSLVEWYRPDGETSPEELSQLMPEFVFQGLSAR